MREWTPLAWWLIVALTFIGAFLTGAYTIGAGRTCEVVTTGPVWVETCTRDVSP